MKGGSGGSPEQRTSTERRRSRARDHIWNIQHRQWVRARSIANKGTLPAIQSRKAAAVSRAKRINRQMARIEDMELAEEDAAPAVGHSFDIEEGEVVDRTELPVDGRGPTDLRAVTEVGAE